MTRGKTREMNVTDSYWQFYQKYMAEKEVNVAKAWNAIIAIATSHHSHLIRNIILNLTWKNELKAVGRAFATIWNTKKRESRNL